MTFNLAVYRSCFKSFGKLGLKSTSSRGWKILVVLSDFNWRNIFLALTLLTCTQAVAQNSNAQNESEPLIANVTFVINSYRGFAFWDSQADYARAVADALGINLTVVYIPEHYSDRFGVVNFFTEYLDRVPRNPDLIISALWLGAELHLLDLLNSKGIPLISINTTLSKRDFAIFGQPREKYPLWLAHFSTNDNLAGYELAEYIVGNVTKQKRCTRFCQINLFAFAGTAYTSASLHRVEGLKTSLKRYPNVSLFNVVSANWDRELTRNMMKKVLSRHDDIDAFWVVGDIMALGVLDGLKDYGAKSYPLIGSMDWTPEIITQIEQGNIAVSFGGHFMEAGWALSIYADYLRKGDFVEKFGVIFSSSLTKLDSSNVASIGGFLKDPKWNVQVIRLNNRYFNPLLQDYVMQPEKIIQLHIEQNAK